MAVSVLDIERTSATTIQPVVRILYLARYEAGVLPEQFRKRYGSGSAQDEWGREIRRYVVGYGRSQDSCW